MLPDVDFEIVAGRVTGLLGPSGSGKTTLMGAIVGVQIVAGGEVEVLGRPAGTPDLRHRVAYMPQAASSYADLSVRENLAYFAKVFGVSGARVDEVIATVDLREQADQVVRTLSGGERSRASLATALLGEPSCSCSTSRRSASIRSCAATSGRRSTGSPTTAQRCSSRAT
ncbi:MAG: ABC transporter ATP-binding protein [Solirubrobacteraceae bacterium]